MKILLWTSAICPTKREIPATTVLVRVRFFTMLLHVDTNWMSCVLIRIRRASQFWREHRVVEETDGWSATDAHHYSQHWEALAGSLSESVGQHQEESTYHGVLPVFDVNIFGKCYWLKVYEWRRWRRANLNECQWAKHTKKDWPHNQSNVPVEEWCKLWRHKRDILARHSSPTVELYSARGVWSVYSDSLKRLTQHSLFISFLRWRKWSAQKLCFIAVSWLMLVSFSFSLRTTQYRLPRIFWYLCDLDSFWRRRLNPTQKSSINFHSFKFSCELYFF